MEGGIVTKKQAMCSYMGSARKSGKTRVQLFCNQIASCPGQCRNSLDYRVFCTLIFERVFARQNGMIPVNQPVFPVSAKSVLFALSHKALYNQLFRKIHFSTRVFVLFLAEAHSVPALPGRVDTLTVTMSL